MFGNALQTRFKPTIEERRHSQRMTSPTSNSPPVVDQHEHLRTIDYVLVYDATEDDAHKKQLRIVFEEAMEKENLLLRHEEIGDLKFVTVFAPFQRLAIEAERENQQMPLKGCEIEPAQPTCCISLSKLLITDDSVDFVSAPFQVKKMHLFNNSEHYMTFFRSALRQLFVHQILINIDIGVHLRDGDSPGGTGASGDDDELVTRKGLPHLLMKEVYTDAFVMHDPSQDEPYYRSLRHRAFIDYCRLVSRMDVDSRQALFKRWRSWFKFQPLTMIRDYFGEKIAFYFAWQGTFCTLLWPAALMGIISFAYGFAKRLKDFFSDLQRLVMMAFDNEFNAIFAVFISLWGTIFQQVWIRNRSVLAYQWDCETYVETEPDRPEYYGIRKQIDPITGTSEWFYPQFRRTVKIAVSVFVVLSSMTAVVVSVIAVVVYKLFAKHYFKCGEDADMTCTVFVSLLPTILNVTSTMILGAIYSKVVEKLTDWENHRTKTGYNNALIVKLFAFQFVNNYAAFFYLAFFRPEANGFQTNGLFGLGEFYKDTCDMGTCGSLLAFQILTHMLIKPFPKFAKDIIIPYFLKIYRQARYGRVVPELLGGSEDEQENNRLMREWMKPDAGDFTLGEFTEKVIQFGCIMMFAPLFPLAPMLALLIGLVDIRIDAHRLLWFNRRPIAVGACDIGIWASIIDFIQYASVISNALIVAYTSQFCDEMREWKAFSECTQFERLLIVLAFQNMVFISKYVIANVIPDVPSSINLAQRRKRFVIAKISESGTVPKIHRSNRKWQRKAKVGHDRVKGLLSNLKQRQEKERPQQSSPPNNFIPENLSGSETG